jgi:predicted GNAT family N-acyltransferase
MSFDSFTIVDGIDVCPKSKFDRLEEENERLTAETRSLKEQLKQTDELIRLMNENEARIKAVNRELLKKISELEYKQKEQRVKKQ